MASTSDDDISELRSYESNGSEEIEEEEEEDYDDVDQIEKEEEIEESELGSESEVDESDNDLEVMEILGQTQQHNQNKSQSIPIGKNIVANGLEKMVSIGENLSEKKDSISKRALFIHPPRLMK